MRFLFTVAAVLLLLAATRLEAQQGRGAPPGPPPTAQASAPLDLTGYWVSIVTEDWLWRMVTPPKGDVASIPLNAAGRKVADAWDLARDNASGEQCKAFGAAAVMRIPGTASDHLAGRQHAQGRNRRGHADAALPFRRNRHEAWRAAVFRDSRLPRGKQAPPAAGVVAASDRSARAPWAG